MHNLYYENDYQRGIHRTALWLVEEVGELAKELKKNFQNLNIEKIEEEMADIYAWTASLANLLEIDLEKALLTKYNNVCPKCMHNPCTCMKNLP